MIDKPKFVRTKIEPRKGPAQKTSHLWDALTERPGKWAEFWGSNGALSTACKHAGFSRPGFTFEGVIRSGKPYVRAIVKEES